MKVSEEFNKFYRAEDIKAPLTRTIDSVSTELLGEEKEKNLIVHFSEPGPSLVAKPMRRAQLVDLYGDDTDAWTGKGITLYTAMVSFGRDRVPSIQVGAPEGQAPAPKAKRGTRPPSPEAAAITAQAPFAGGDPDDDISDI